MRWRTDPGLVYGWLFENRAPHTAWSESGRDGVVPVEAHGQ
jgi:hypothetical protein